MGWIRAGDGMPNTFIFFDFRRFFDIWGFSKNWSGVIPIPVRGDPHTRPGRPPYQSGAAPIPVRGGPPYQSEALEIAGDRGFVLSLGGLCCLLGLCLICRGFVLSVGALYSLLGLCLVISCIPIQFSPHPRAPRQAAPGPTAGGPIIDIDILHNLVIGLMWPTRFPALAS